MDRLTQLQDSIDNFLNLAYTAQNYIQTQHPHPHIPGQPSLAPKTTPADHQLTNGHNPVTAANNETVNNDNNEAATPTQQPQSAGQSEADFPTTLHALARALVLQEQQMEILIHALPGLERGEREQDERITVLEREVRGLEAERRAVEAERERVVKGLGGVVVNGARRIPGG